MRILLLAALGVLVSACNPTVDATKYDQSCGADADCVAVFSGALCAVCGGGANAAINVSAKEKYDADVAMLQGGCGPQLGGAPKCSPRQLRSAVCASGSCALAPP